MVTQYSTVHNVQRRGAKKELKVNSLKDKYYCKCQIHIVVVQTDDVYQVN